MNGALLLTLNVIVPSVLTMDCRWRRRLATNSPVCFTKFAL